MKKNGSLPRCYKILRYHISHQPQTAKGASMRKPLLSGIVTILLILLTLASSWAQQRTIRVGAFNYYPGIFQDKDGVVKGFYVDALTEIGKRENIRFEYVYGSWSEGLERLKAGQVDLLTSVAHTPERAEFMDYPQTPLLTVWGELYVPLSSQIDGIRDIKGKKVAIMKSDVNARHFINLVEKFDTTCTFIELPGFDDVFKAVAAGTVDAGVVNSTFGAAKQKEYGLRSTGVVFNPFDIFFTVAKGKNADLLALLDNYLKSWRHQENSVFNQARQKWSHGTIGTMQIVPRWLSNAVIILFILFFVATVFIVLLKQQVRHATAEVMQREAHLRESEERYRNIFENNHSVMLIIDPVNGAIIDANPVAAAYYGWSRAELLTMNIADINSMTQEEIAAEMALARARKQDHFYFRHRLANGALRDVETISGPIEIDGKPRLFSIIYDITERKRIEETYDFLLQSAALNSEHNFFEELARYLAGCLEMDYVCIDRLISDGLTARTVAIYFDGNFEDNVEYGLKDTPCGDVVGKSICVFQQEVRHLFPQDTVLQEMAAESYVGTTLWGFNGRPIGLIAVIGRKSLPDPHLAESVLKLVAVRAAGELERKLAEDALVESEERYRTLVQNAPIGVFVNRGGRVVLANRDCQRLFGATSEEQLLGKSPFELFHPDFHPTMQERIRQVLIEGKPAPQTEDRIIRLDGVPVEVEINAAPFRDKGEDAIHVVLRDITERKKFEKELLAKNAELERFTYTVSHDLKSPLITIQFFTGQVANDIESGKHHHLLDDLKKISDAATKMTALLNDLLELSRIGRMINEPETADMNLLVEDVLKQLAGPLAQKRIQIQVQQNLSPIHGDRRRLFGVLQNLIENAIKFMGEQPAPLIKVGERRDGGERVFFIRDNGIGIEARHQEQIFGLFNKLDPNSAGTGIGLALVRRIIEVHGGRIWVESDGPGQGCCFCFSLPDQNRPNSADTSNGEAR